MGKSNIQIFSKREGTRCINRFKVPLCNLTDQYYNPLHSGSELHHHLEEEYYKYLKINISKVVTRASEDDLGLVQTNTLSTKPIPVGTRYF